MGTRKRAGKAHDKKSGRGRKHRERQSSADSEADNSHEMNEKTSKSSISTTGNYRWIFLAVILLLVLSAGTFVMVGQGPSDDSSNILERGVPTNSDEQAASEHAERQTGGLQQDHESTINSVTRDKVQGSDQSTTDTSNSDKQSQTGTQPRAESESQGMPNPDTDNKDPHRKQSDSKTSHTSDKHETKPETDEESSSKEEQHPTDSSSTSNKDSQSTTKKNSKVDTTASATEKTKDEPSKSNKKADKKAYGKADITNSQDNKIRGELDEAEAWITQRRPGEAITRLDAILTRYPQSARATYLRAEALCVQAELEMSNPILEQCIQQYLKVLDLPDVPQALMLKSGRACATRQQFRGWGQKAAGVLHRLIQMYPDEQSLWNEIGVQNLMINRYQESREAFQEMLRLSPRDAVALVHLGFIQKVSDNDPEGAIPLLRAALSSDDSRVHDGRFYFHLGDALQRLGNTTEAYAWYTRGAELGLFRSKWQRSLYNVDHLDSWPWWTHEQTRQSKLIKTLEENWETIRDEGLANMDDSGGFRPEEENLRETGIWKQLTLYQQGQKNEKNCQKAPKTCRLLEQFPEATGCKRGQIKYSVMQPGVHVWPHCGPTNCRIRAHLGLVVPDNCCRIRVTDDVRTWQEGKVLVFDDSFEHEVWHDGDSLRLVLIIDVWHPDLTQREKATLSPI